jgi:hypothetical protein
MLLDWRNRRRPPSDVPLVTELLRPTLDVVFKLLFSDKRNENLLRSLVSTLLDPAVPIADLEVLNPETTKESVRAKGAVLDVRVRLANRCQAPALPRDIRPGVAIDAPPLLKWARFLKAETRDVLESLAELWDFNYRTALRSAERRGRAEGLAEGRTLGASLVLQKQLTRRFGELPARALERLGSQSTVTDHENAS